jgi:DNA-binding LacI/PurR family transcriptional regulator
VNDAAPATGGRRRPARPARPPVMADVARLAGVSLQTVSRVLNDHPNVHPATREKVRAAIRKLEYRPNRAARTLATRHTRTLGVVSADSAAHGPASILAGIEEGARAAGYSVTVAALAVLDGPGLAGAMGYLAGSGVDGMVVVAPRSASTVPLRVPECGGIPVVSVGRALSGVHGRVAVDHAAAARRATGYLLDLGHATVHHVSGPCSWPDMHERETGWRRALGERGAPAHPVLRGADLSARTGYRAGRSAAAAILGGGAEITALLCAGDHLALGAIRALQDTGLRVPEDVSVVGFDDIPESPYFGPPLTTVRQDYRALGRRALEMLVDLVETAAPRTGESAPRSRAQRQPARVALRLELVLRDSCAPPPWTARSIPRGRGEPVPSPPRPAAGPHDPLNAPA